MAETGSSYPGPDRRRADFLGARRTTPSAAQALRRRWLIGLAKGALPIAALALLALLTLWPELTGDLERARISYRRQAVVQDGGTLRNPRYTGFDENGSPFTITAASARQIMTGPQTPGRTELVQPTGDILLAGGTWLMAKSDRGVYMQRDGQLDLFGEVSLYRDDGIEMQTSALTIDLKAATVIGPEQVHVQGPFGTLDAQGFSVMDRGAVLYFTGPGRLKLDGAGR
jgi:lipopolysaccharide export system protein LptC